MTSMLLLELNTRVPNTKCEWTLKLIKLCIQNLYGQSHGCLLSREKGQI
jgi:hypothetical protein